MKSKSGETGIKGLGGSWVLTKRQNPQMVGAGAPLLQGHCFRAKSKSGEIIMEDRKQIKILLNRYATKKSVGQLILSLILILTPLPRVSSIY